jgi:hypothetical protein
MFMRCQWYPQASKKSLIGRAFTKEIDPVGVTTETSSNGDVTTVSVLREKLARCGNT